MARYSINNLRTDINRKLKTGGASASLDFYGAIDEGRRNIVREVAPPEMVREAYLEDAIYDKVDKYAVPADLNYDDVIELKKLSAYRNVDTLQHPFEIVFRKRFDQKRRTARNVMSISYTNGLKTASIFHPKGLKECQQQLINECDSLSANGTWNVSGNVVNLTEDRLDFVSGKASLRFDFDGSATQGFLENFTMKPVDLHDYLQVGAVFAPFKTTKFKDILSVRIRLYSSATDYYDYTVSHPHDDNVFMDGWNLLKFIFSNQYRQGTPNPRAINHVRFDFVTTGQPIYACHIDSVIARKGAVYQATYQSSYCIIDALTGAWKHRATSGSDLLPFEDDSYQVFMLECALVLQQELYANNVGAKQDISDIADELAKAYAQYRMVHPGEPLEEYDTTYIFGNYFDGYTDDLLNDDYNRGEQDDYRQYEQH